jgi:hypothetical protein
MWFLASFGVALCLGQSAVGLSAHAGMAAGAVPPTIETVRARLAGLSVPWVGNAGQWDARAAWRAQTFAGASWVTKDGLLVHEFTGPRAADCAGEKASDAPPRRRGEACPRGPGWVLTERFVGGRIGPTEGQRPQAGRVSYFTAGREAAELPTFEALDLGEVYPGVRVELKARAGNVEKLYTVAPHREAGVIRMRLEGARAVRIAQDGALEAETEHGPVRFTAPVAFQHDARGERREIMVRYALLTRTAKAVDYGFELGDYDRNRPLTIDPLLQSTYLGGSGADRATALAVHPQSGDVYVAGFTSGSFPGTSGGAQASHGGDFDAFVARLNDTLTSLQQATYVGGGGIDRAHALAIHPLSGEVYVAGLTTSSPFPGTSGGAQASHGEEGGSDAYIARFNAALTSLHQSTYLGGAGNDAAYALAIHPRSGEVYVAGETTGAFPATSGGAQSTHGGGGFFDAFVARLNAALTSLHQSTYLGGSSVDRAYAVAIHPLTGEIYVAGDTSSNPFPGTSDGAQPTFGGGSDDAFVARFNAALTVRHQSTYLGGSGSDRLAALAIHPLTGDVYLAGTTGSGSFPGASGGAQPVYGGADDAFVARLHAALTVRLQATYLGGSGSDQALALAIHPVSGDVYVAGRTASTSFPGVAGGALAVYGGSTADAFVARLNTWLTVLRQSTYIGGGGVDQANALAIHPSSGEVYVAGTTDSNPFPGTSGGAQTSAGGLQDAFVSRLSLDLIAADVVPDPFIFPAQFGVPVSSLRTAGPVQVTGIAAPAPITIDGALGSQVCISTTSGCTCDASPGGIWGTATSITNNHYLCVRHVSAASVQTFSETRLTVGGYATKFSTYTGALPACTLDMDNDGQVTASKEMLVMTRARLGFTPAQAVVGTGITQAQWDAKRAELATCGIVFP